MRIFHKKDWISILLYLQKSLLSKYKLIQEFQVFFFWHYPIHLIYEHRDELAVMYQNCLSNAQKHLLFHYKSFLEIFYYYICVFCLSLLCMCYFPFLSSHSLLIFLLLFFLIRVLVLHLSELVCCIWKTSWLIARPTSHQ